MPPGLASRNHARKSSTEGEEWLRQVKNLMNRESAMHHLPFKRATITWKMPLVPHSAM